MLDEDDSEDTEHFVILLESVVGATISCTKEFRVHNGDNDGPDPILREIEGMSSPGPRRWSKTSRV